jgi:ABC-type lipoprotein release transport system permease subunit
MAKRDQPLDRFWDRPLPDLLEALQATPAGLTSEEASRRLRLHGAKTRDILSQFLVEAVTLSLLGGMMGIVTGLAASALISYFAQWSTHVSPLSILMAFVFSALVGVFFGYYPARKAAYLDPIEALRYE